MKPILYAQATFGKPEKDLVMDVFKKGWFSGGHYTDLFEKKLAKWWGVKYALSVNSGSSANFVALQALGLNRGDEVLTMAMGFPTTLSPIIYHGLEPVFLDCHLPSYTIKLDDKAVSSKTKALFFAHTLGNVANMDEVVSFCKRHDLKLIEDCCDAVSSTWKGQKVGTFGDLATVSFYPAHHMTTFGEGGAILTNDPALYHKIKSIRDWGRACFCPWDKSNVCGKRFANPPFDHKYYYINLGLNFKMTEASAAFGVAQLDRLDRFIERRRRNFGILYKRLKGKVTVPQVFKGADPSWFAFPIMHPDKNRIVEHLESKGIQTRALFGGNLLKHPAFKGKGRTPVDLSNSDRVLKEVFFVGIAPRLTTKELNYIADTILD